MDVSNWSLDNIMQLPDWCFGRRWSATCEVQSTADVDAFDISEINMPDVGVLWQFVWDPYDVEALTAYCRIAWAHRLAKTEAEFMENEPVLHGFGIQGPSPRKITDYDHGGPISINLRQPVQPQGKRLSMMGHSVGASAAEARCIIVISSLPKEVPDWVVSGLAGMR